MVRSLSTWWLKGEAVQNFGDFLSSLLEEDLFLPLGLDGSAVHVIGSVIDDGLLARASDERPAVFWGGGCRDTDGVDPALRTRGRFLAVRGPRSRTVLGLGSDVPMGDPGLLLPALVTPRSSCRTTGRSVVVPHFHDRRDDAALLDASGADVVVRVAIPATRAALLAVIDDLVSADFVLSAALHGAVVAMAWGRPFGYWDSGAVDLPFKWEDVSALVGIETGFSPDIDAARDWFDQTARGRLRIPPLLDLVAAAPFLVRPDALLRIVQMEIERAPDGASAAALLRRAVEVHAAQRSLVDRIAGHATTRLADLEQLARRQDAMSARLAELDRALAGRITAEVVAAGAIATARAEVEQARTLDAVRREELGSERAAGAALRAQLDDEQATVTALRRELHVGEGTIGSLRGELHDERRSLAASHEQRRRDGTAITALREVVQRQREDAALETFRLSRGRPAPGGLARWLRSGARIVLDRARRRAGVGWVNPLFDAAWYHERYPDLRRVPIWAAIHWRRHGRAEGRRPNALFDPAWYLAHHPDVAASGLDPLDHHWFHGAIEGRDPGPGFSTRWYLAANPDVAASGMHPLQHWLRHGRAEGRLTRPPDGARGMATSAGSGGEAGAPVDAEEPGATPGAGGGRSTDGAVAGHTTLEVPAAVAADPAGPAAVGVPAAADAIFGADWGYGIPAGAAVPRRDASLVSRPLVLDEVSLHVDKGSARLMCGLGDGRTFWIEVRGPDEVIGALEPRVEPFLPPAILLAVAEHRPVRVVPPLEPLHARRLRQRMMPLLSGLFEEPDAPIELRADPGMRLEAGPPDRRALLFSGGVDSMYSLERMVREGWPPDLLVNVNAGASDLDRTCWARRLDRVGAFAAELGVPLVVIDTNLHELGWLPHAAVHPFRNVAAASVLQPVVGELVMSSEHRMESMSFTESRPQEVLLVEPLALDALRWGGLELTLLGDDVRRMDKLAALGASARATRTLDLCTDQRYQATAAADAPVNCGRCFKCARTILLLEHLGTLDRFAARFDMAAFASRRAAADETLRTGYGHAFGDARWLLSAPRGTVPAFRRGWIPPDHPTLPPAMGGGVVDGRATAASSAAAVTVRQTMPPPRPLPGGIPKGGRPPRRDPALADVPLVLDEVRIDRDGDTISLTCPLGDGRELWIRTRAPDAILERIAPRLEPFIPPALLLAAVEGRPVRIAPPISARYERQLRHRLIPLVSAFVADDDVLVLRTVGPAEPPPPGPRSVTGLLFSGGVDSMHALQRMQREGWPPDLLVNLNAGAHDVDRACWARRLVGVSAVAKELRVPLVTIDTNLHELAWVPHPIGHTFRNLGAASVLQAAVGTLVYSAGHRLEVTSFRVAHELRGDLMEPVTTPAMAWGGLELLLVGNDTGKAYKIAGLADNPLANRYLDICVDQGYQGRARPDDPINCGRCFKCAAAIVLMEHLGILDRFAACFDLAAFETVRGWAMERVRTEPFHLDNEARSVLAMPRGEMPPLLRGVLAPPPGAEASDRGQADRGSSRLPSPPAATGIASPSEATPAPRRDATPLVLARVEVDRAHDRVRLSASLGDGRALWIEVHGPADILAALEPRVEPFIAPALLVAGRERRPLRIDHVMDPVDPVRSTAPGERTALVFTGGVDSFATLQRMQRGRWRADLLVNVNVGAHDADRTCWRRRLARAGGVAQELGVPLVSIDTDFHELDGFSQVTAHVFRSLAAASVLRPVAGTVVHSSGHRLEATSFEDSQRLGQDLMEPVAVDAVRWGGLDLVLVGSDVRRVDKMAALGDLPLAMRFLDVCVDQGYGASAPADAPTNCGDCQECARTIVTLEHLGILERFAACFDLAAFEAGRARWLGLLRERDHPIDLELRQMLASPRGTLPPIVRGALPQSGPTSSAEAGR